MQVVQPLVPRATAAARRWLTPPSARSMRGARARAIDFLKPRPGTKPADSLAARAQRFREDAETEEPAMLALQLMAAGRLREAFEVTELALHREADDADVLFVQGRLLHELRDYDAARDALTGALRLAPGWKEPWKVLLRVLAAARRDRGRRSSSRDAADPAPVRPDVPRAPDAARSAWGLPSPAREPPDRPVVRCRLAA